MKAAKPRAHSPVMPTQRSWVAERAIKDVELSVGGQRIDKHYQTLVEALLRALPR